ncbi:hypothetical protein QO002_005767 [Pararhizobium capsulatum DSM 1112]|uniref:Uncharacterized protein n=1 Tax=Pararhizobium capsulatum DSM 1112 TaxID=1121113 RepID=A0ABU0BZ79_9HYPH|nr:hypothetical protein [Pararhizobium capsulatum]MDQ0323561.1 hypothetical protein [Pararhizobium capsulatum DSM 1112]
MTARHPHPMISFHRLKTARFKVETEMAGLISRLELQGLAKPEIGLHLAAVADDCAAELVKARRVEE